MKRNRELAKKYAAALLAIAKDTGALEEVENELTAIGRTLAADAEFRAFLRHPLLARGTKKEAVEAIFKDSVQPVVLQFLGVVVERGRGDVLDEIISEYIRLSQEERNIAEAKIRSAVPLTAEERERLTERLGAVTGKQVYLTETVDPSILGGMVVTIGDRMIDGSLQRQLQEMKGILLPDNLGIEVTNGI